MLLLIVAGAVWIVGIAAAAIAVQRWRARGSRSTSPLNGSSRPGRAPTAQDVGVHPATFSAAEEPRCEAADEIAAVSPAPAIRFPYPTQQWAAPCVRGELPEADDFFQVECRELYDGGISFYPPVAMEWDSVVISLGNSNTLVFMLARVVSQQVEVADERSRPVVDCQFIRRVREDAGRWARALKTAAPATASTN